MNGAFRVEGDWPSPITLSRGWGKAIARPWNDEAPDGFLRLLRGRTDFLQAATEDVASRSGSGVFSPAMFNPSTPIWKRTGYEEVRRLDVMERPLGAEIESPQLPVDQSADPPWERLMAIDRSAFTGFWRMSLDGLREAVTSTSQSTTLTASVDGEIVGYLIAGAQWGTAYLQRVAVEAGTTGAGVGTALVRAAVEWARQTSAASMVLNVRPENERATSLYERCGFSGTGKTLRILRWGETRLLEAE